MTATSPDPQPPASTEPAAYHTALAAYQDAIQRANRLEGIQRGVPLERQDPDLWREQDAAWLVVDHERRRLIATAPDQATSWWPGGWMAVSETRQFGYSDLPGQVEGTNIWRTEQEARAGRPAWEPERTWMTSWTPTARTDFRNAVPLDAAFWETHSASCAEGSPNESGPS